MARVRHADGDTRAVQQGTNVGGRVAQDEPVVAPASGGRKVLACIGHHTALDKLCSRCTGTGVTVRPYCGRTFERV